MTQRMTREELRDAIDQKYIAPIRRPEGKHVGVELEFPIVNTRKEPVDFQVIHEMTDAFMERFGFVVASIDDEGNINAAESEETGDDLSFDCSYNTLEFSFGLEENINVLDARFREYYAFVQDFLKEHDHKLTGMGINPHHHVNRNVPVPNGRYRMLLHHLESYGNYRDRMLFHEEPNYGLFTCASQTHVDVTEETAVRTINAFSKLEPLKALLLANSPWKDMLCSRDYFWRQSTHGLNPHNVGAYEKEFGSIDEVVAYYMSMSLYCIERDGHYINFEPTPLETYFNSDRVKGEYYDGQGYSDYEWEPGIEDLKYLRSFKFEDLTFRGTIEFRSVCEQPASEAFAASAFHAGLKANLAELEEYLSKTRGIYDQGYSTSELRDLFVQKELPTFLNKDHAAGILTDVVEIAGKGLSLRGLGEEHFLGPLYERAKTLNSPGREWIEGLQQGRSTEYYIDKFSEI